MNIKKLINYIENETKYVLDDIKIDCIYFKIMCILCDLMKENDTIDNNLNNLLINSIDEFGLKLLNLNTLNGKWVLYSNLTNYEKRFYISKLSNIRIGSFLFFIPDFSSIDSCIFYVNNKIYIKEKKSSDYIILGIDENNYLNIFKEYSIIGNQDYRDIVISNIIKS